MARSRTMHANSGAAVQVEGKERKHNGGRTTHVVGVGPASPRASDPNHTCTEIKCSTSIQGYSGDELFRNRIDWVLI